MDGFDWSELLEVAVPIALTAGAGLLTWAFVAGRKFVKSTETKIDDKILAALEKAFKDSAGPKQDT